MYSRVPYQCIASVLKQILCKHIDKFIRDIRVLPVMATKPPNIEFSMSWTINFLLLIMYLNEQGNEKYKPMN